MAKNLKPVSQLDFSGGANYVVNPYLISQKQTADLVNLILEEHGSLKTRDGQKELSVSPLNGVNDPIRLIQTLNRVSGADFPFVIQRNSGSGINRLYVTNTNPWTNIGAAFTQDEEIPDTAFMNNKAIIANGYEVPQVFNGTTSIPIVNNNVGHSLPPGAKHLSFHLGSLWLWNTAATTSTFDGPSSLRMSDASTTANPQNQNFWTDSSQTFISKDDGQQGMGMTSFTIVETGISPTATLVLFKDYTAYQVTGVFGSADFSIQRIKSDMGCIAPRTIQFVSGFGAIRLTHKGFALYNGVEDRLISEEIRPQIFGGRGFSAINFATAIRCYATQSQNPPLYVCACPVDSTGKLTRIFIYDLIRRGWSTMTLPQAVQSFTLILTGATVSLPQVRAGTSEGGRLLELFNGYTKDDLGNMTSQEISWSMRTRSFFSTSSMQPSFWRRFQVQAEGPPNRLVNITPIVDGKARIVQEHYIGDNPPETADTSDPVETVMSGPIMETANHVQINVAGTGTVRIRGIELHTSPKPVTEYRSRR